MSDETTILAPCSQCLRQTRHGVLQSVEKKHLEDFELHQIIECAGCGAVSFAHRWIEAEGFEEEDDDDDDDGPPPPADEYFPSPISRRKPQWFASWSLGVPVGFEEGFVGFEEGDDKRSVLFGLLNEIYQAINGGQHRLAAMGIRSLLEAIMVEKVGDHGTFGKNLNAFKEQGYVSLLQYDAMNAVLDAGHAVTHRFYEPSKRDLGTALDIAEGIFAAIYVQSRQGQELSDRVPPRQSRSKSPKS